MLRSDGIDFVANTNTQASETGQKHSMDFHDYTAPKAVKLQETSSSVVPAFFLDVYNRNAKDSRHFYEDFIKKDSVERKDRLLKDEQLNANMLQMRDQYLSEIHELKEEKKELKAENKELKAEIKGLFNVHHEKNAALYDLNKLTNEHDTLQTLHKETEAKVEKLADLEQQNAELTRKLDVAMEVMEEACEYSGDDQEMQHQAIVSLKESNKKLVETCFKLEEDLKRTKTKLREATSTG